MDHHGSGEDTPCGARWRLERACSPSSAGLEMSVVPGKVRHVAPVLSNADQNATPT